ncbi:MAG: DinB family protein [Planctomycetes bacterium]|nr:DinB family protein [Planctomycetota bacterium]
MTTSTATTVGVGSMISFNLRMAMTYAEKLCADIPADKFGHIPMKGVNHPLFCIGHLGLYAERALTLIGREDLARKVDPKQEELFKNGAPCLEQDGRYPNKDAVLKNYMERYKVVADALPEVSDETFARANPMGGRMTEILPTIGAATMFMCGSHLQMHLGQISAWRRVIGMGSCM